MGLLNVKLPTPEGVGAGQTAIFKLPLGMSYHVLQLRLKHGATPADATEAEFADLIERVRLKVNGKVKWDIPGDYLVMRNAFHKQSFKAGVLNIFLAQPWLRTIAGEDEMAWGTADLQSLTMEVDLKDTIVNPKLEGYARQGANAKFGKHIAILQYQKSNSVAGQVEISDITRGNYALMAVHVNRSDIEEFELKVNRSTLLEGDKVIHEASCLDRREFQAGWFHADMTNRDRIGDVLPLAVQDFRLIMQCTSTGAMPIYVERVEATVQ